MASDSVAADALPLISATDDDVVVFGRTFPYRYVVAVLFVSALFLDILDSTIVNVAIPSIGRDLRTEAVEWVVIGYTLSLAVFIPASGWLGDRFGTKRVFMTALVIFIGCSALCGAASNLEQLVLFRILQGAGRGDVDAGRYRHDVPGLPAGPARPGGDDRDDSHVARAGPRSRAGRPAHRFGGLAVDLLRQRPGRAGRHRVRRPLPAGAHRADGRSFRCGRVRAVGGRPGRHRVRPQRGSGRGLDERARLGPGSAGCARVRRSGAGRDEPSRADAGAAPAAGATVPGIEHRDGVGHGGLCRAHLRAAVVRAEPEGSRCPREWTHDIPAGVGRAGVVAAGGSHLRPGRPASADGVRHVAGRGRDGDVRLHRSRHRSVVPPAVVVRPGVRALGFPFVASQAASYARVMPVDNGRASAIFATQRQMAVSLGIALLATVLSIFMPLVGPPADAARSMHGYRIAFVVAAALPALAAVAAWRLVRDADAAETMVPRHRRRPAAPESAPA